MDDSDDQLNGTINSKNIGQYNNGRRFLNKIISKKSYFIIIAFAVVGVVALIISKAATTPTSFEAESTTLSGCATTISDPSASAGKAITLNCQVNTSTNGFNHPGILLDRSQLEFIKAKVAGNQQPWKAAYDQLKASSLASKSYTPQPVTEVKCSTGSYVTKYPQAGCASQIKDATAAYSLALMWYLSGDSGYATKAVEIMNSWARTNTSILFDQPRELNGVAVYGATSGPQIYGNGMLQAGWSAQVMTRAAEIIRYTSTTWTASDIAKAETYFKNVHYNVIKNGWTGGGNWETTFAEAMTNIGIFTNDHTIYDKGIGWWRQQAPALIYRTTDGANPIAPPGGIFNTASQIKTRWYEPTSYVDGQTLETCRDLGHTMMGLGGLANTAETARIQGIDLYGEQQARMVSGFERNASYVNQLLDKMAASNQTADQITKSTWVPTNQWPCTDFSDGGESAFLGFELAYNHYANRKGLSMPNTRAVVLRTRPSKIGNHLGWETLTHAETGSVGPLQSNAATSSIAAPTTSTYRLWARIKALNTTNNSIGVKVDNGSPYRVGDGQITPNTWTWVDFNNGNKNAKINLNLSSGNHSFTIISAVPGVSVDRIMITSLDCLPTGFGDNCSNITTQSFPTGKTITGNLISSGQCLSAGQSISYSGNSNVVFSMQTDGNAVLYDANIAKWATGTTGLNNRICMQTDGNIVVYSSTSIALWNSNTSGLTGTGSSAGSNKYQLAFVCTNPADIKSISGVGIIISTPFNANKLAWVSYRRSTLAIWSGQILSQNQSLTSDDGRYRATMQTDGNLVINNGTSNIWSSGTTGSPTIKALDNFFMLGLSLADSSGATPWRADFSFSSAPSTSYASTLVMQTDGNLVAYSNDGRALWQSGTSGR